MGTIHLKDPFVLSGFESSALSLPLFHLSHALPLFFDNGKGSLYKKKNLMALNDLMRRCAFISPHSSLASTSTKRKEYYFIRFQVIVGLEVMKRQMLMPKLVF